MDFGVSFSPTGDGQQRNQQDPQGSQTPIQDAIKLLSLRIPSFRGQGGIAPQSLMQGSGSLGVMGQAGPGGMQQMLAQLFGQQGQSAPTPNITPGLNQTGQAPNLSESQMPTGPTETNFPGPPNFPSYYNNPMNGGGINPNAGGGIDYQQQRGPRF